MTVNRSYGATGRYGGSSRAANGDVSLQRVGIRPLQFQVCVTSNQAARHREVDLIQAGESGSKPGESDGGRLSIAGGIVQINERGGVGIAQRRSRGSRSVLDRRGDRAQSRSIEGYGLADMRGIGFETTE